MIYFFEHFGLLFGAILSAVSVFLRYLLFAGPAFWIFYILYRRVFLPWKIQTKLPPKQSIVNEIQHSANTAIVFGVIGIGIHLGYSLGYTQIYFDLHEFGWTYAWVSLIGLIFIHDTYFYWVHRLMHHPKLFRVFHRVHHLSHNPTPWSSLSFHPLEAIVEVAIVPILILFVPLHPLVLFVFATWSLTWNVIGHLGFEVFPKGFVTHPILKWFNTSTHHNMHHERSGCNYGLYFNFWDTWMGTNHPDYQARFEEVKAGR